MSIQSSVNQGISVFSMLLSQSPMAKARQERAAIAEQAKQHEIDLQKADDRHKQALARKKADLETVWKNTKADVPELYHTNAKGTTSAIRANPEKVRTVKAAIAAGEALYKQFPSTALYDELRPLRHYAELPSFKEREVSMALEKEHLKRVERARSKAETAKILEQDRIAETPKTEDTK